MRLANKVVLVTGASSGIGAATAILFAKEGANVVIVGRNEEKLKNVAAKIESSGKKPLVIKADVSKDSDAKSIIKKTIDEFGNLDVLVNNAGLVKYGTILNGKVLEDFDEIIATNLRAVIHLTTLAAPYLTATKGNIVNVSSVASLVIKQPFLTAYSVSKAALDHFTRGAALELAPLGVRVNSVNPGPVKTDILENAGQGVALSWDALLNTTALKRIAEPEEIADLILYLASDRAKSVTGSTFVSDNGYMLRIYPYGYIR